jgi:hypothetical protein
MSIPSYGKSSSMAEHKHNDASCETCETLKNEEKEKLKQDLKNCAVARDAAEREKKTELEKTALEAEEKVEKMKKQLIAFQLATVVGVTILGQEAFDKIFAKVEEVKSVQDKITGINSGEDKTEKPKNGAKGVSFNGFKPISTLNLIDYSTFGQNIIITDSRTDQNAPWTPSESTISTTSVTQPTQLIVDPPISTPPTVASVTNYDFPVVMMDVPTTIASLQYPLLPFQDSPFAFGQETSSISPVPTPNSISVFALSLINAPRRRMA